MTKLISLDTANATVETMNAFGLDSDHVLGYDFRRQRNGSIVAVPRNGGITIVYSNGSWTRENGGSPW